MIIDFYAYDKEQILGGPMVWIQRIVPLLLERGYHVRLKLFNWSCVENGVLFQWCKDKGLNFEATRFTSTESNVAWMIKKHDESPPDIAILNHVTPALLLAGHMKRTGVPTVAVLHSDDSFYHGLAETFVNGEQKYAVSAAVFVSKDLLSKYQNTLNDCERLYIPYGVPCPSFHATFPKDRRLGIAYVGRLSKEQKRIIDVAKAFEECVASQQNIEGFFIGDGPDRLELEGFINQSAFRDRLHLCGAMQPSIIQSFLSKHCQFICLLSDYEGLPIALMEAMAIGLVPVCLTTNSGIPELVKHGWNGIVLENKGASIVDHLRQISGDSNRWREMSENCKQLISQSYSLTVAIDGWCELLESLARENRIKSPITTFFHYSELPKPHPSMTAEDTRFSITNSTEPQTGFRISKFKKRIAKLIKKLLSE